MPTNDTLRNLIDNDVPVHIVGDPGGGKTASVVELAEGAGAHQETRILSAYEPSDMAGLPTPTPKGVQFLMPGYAHRLNDAADAGRQTMLIMDEFSCASPSLQAPALQLVLARRMDDWGLPTKESKGGICRVVLISNPRETAAGGYDMTPPMANRMAHFSWSMTYQAWSEWAMRSNELAPKWTMARVPQEQYADRWNRSLARIVGFLKSRTLLFALPEDPEQRSGPWPSPRTWHLASRVEFDPEAMACIVGPGAAAEFIQWRNNADLPDPDDLLSGKAKMPEREDAMFASIMAVVSVAKADEKKQPKAWELILAMPTVDLKIPPARALAISSKQFPPQLVKILPDIERITR